MKYVCVICIISNCVSGPVGRGEEGQSCGAGRPRLRLASSLEAVVLVSWGTTRLRM